MGVKVGGKIVGVAVRTRVEVKVEDAVIDGVKVGGNEGVMVTGGNVKVAVGAFAVRVANISAAIWVDVTELWEGEVQDAITRSIAHNCDTSRHRAVW